MRLGTGHWRRALPKRLERKEQEIRKGRGTKEVHMQLAMEELFKLCGPWVV